jgi:hypothetical protein
MAAVLLSRLAAVAFFAGSAVRLVLGVTGAVRLSGGVPMTMMAVGIGAIAGILIGLALWLRPGRVSALIGILFGFYAVVSVALLQVVGFDSAFILIVAIGVVAFGLSVAAFWKAGRELAARP